MVEQESFFSFEELFFSRTDTRGIILSGNSVFHRVSEYTWEELLKKPHNLIRHPDMPKGVFYLFWKTVQAGNPIGAFVKNRSKTRKPYWVFALAFPIDGGYLSIRIKPSSKIFEIVKQEYEKLLDLEQKGNDPAASMAQLLNDLKSLGFSDYNSFMTAALKAELEARQASLNRPPIQILSRLSTMIESGQTLKKKAGEVLAAYKATAHVPLNLEIRTAHLGDKAAPLAVVAAKYEAMAKEIQPDIVNFFTTSEQAQSKIAEAQFNVCAGLLQAEVYNFFEAEKESGPIDVPHELKLLLDVKQKGLGQALVSLKQVEDEFDRFEVKCQELKTVASALEIVRLTGKIEASKIEDAGGDLKGFIDELTVFRRKLSQTLDEIEIFSRNLRESALEIKSEAQILAKPPPTLQGR